MRQIEAAVSILDGVWVDVGRRIAGIDDLKKALGEWEDLHLRALKVLDKRPISYIDTTHDRRH